MLYSYILPKQQMFRKFFHYRLCGRMKWLCGPDLAHGP